MLARFTGSHGMAWPQIYDGKYIDSPLARQFGITLVPHATGIPYTLLVDGDTGLLIAAGEATRGTNLAATVESALATKQLAPK